MAALFSPLGLPPLPGLFLHQKVPAKLEAESSGEGDGRKDDSFILHLLLKFLLKMKVKGAGRSFALIVFPSFTHVLAQRSRTKARRFFFMCFLQTVSIADLVLSCYCILTNNNILWGHFISKSACMIPLSPHCSFNNS